MIYLLPLLCVFWPLLLATLAPFLDILLRKWRNLIPIFGTSVSFIAAISMVPYVLAGHIFDLKVLSVRIDHYNLATVVGITLICFLTSFYNFRSEIGGRLKPVFYNVFLLSMISVMLTLVSSYNLFLIFLCVEMTVGLSVILVLHTPGKKTMSAAFKYLVITAMSALLVLIGVLLVYGLTGTLNLYSIVEDPELLKAQPHLLLLIVACFIAGFGADVGLAPFHGWLPDVYPITTPALNSFFCAESLAILFVIYRVVLPFYQIFPSDIIIVLLLGVGLFSMVLGVLLAYRQTDFIRMFAYSSLDQYGHVLFAFSFMTNLSYFAGQMQLVNHALMKAGFVLSLGSVFIITGLRDMEALGGLGDGMKKTALSYILCALSLAGIPPLSGFYSKWLICNALYDFVLTRFGLWVAVLSLLFFMVISIISLTFLLRSFHKIFWGEKTKVFSNVKEPSVLMWLPSLVLALLGVAIGVLPQLILDLVGMP